MKTLVMQFIAILFSYSLIGQTINPKQYDVLKNEDIQIEKGKRKDGTYSSPYLATDLNIRFSPNGDFLFIFKDDEKTEGKFVVYSTSEKRVVKTIKVPKTGMFSTAGFTINPKNIYQVAITSNKAEVNVIMDWSKTPEDALIKKGSEGIVKIKAACQYGGQYAFSDDGKNLFIMEDEKTPIKNVELSSGKINTIAAPSGKSFYYRNGTNPFIGNDEALIVSENGNKKSAEIYQLSTGQIIRTYDISGFIASPNNYGYAPHLLIFNFDGFVLNLITGEKNETAKNIIAGLGATDGNSVKFYPIQGKGYIANHSYYKETNGSYYKGYTKTTVTSTSQQSNLLFFDVVAKNPLNLNFPSVNRELPWTDLYQLQISSNGKYAVFSHKDINNNKNDCWIIVEL